MEAEIGDFEEVFEHEHEIKYETLSENIAKAAAQKDIATVLEWLGPTQHQQTYAIQPLPKNE